MPKADVKATELSFVTWLIKELANRYGPDLVNEAIAIAAGDVTGVMTWAGSGKPGDATPLEGGIVHRQGSVVVVVTP